MGQWLQTHFNLTTCVGTCMRLITMEMSIDVKLKCDENKINNKNTLKK